VEVVEVSEPGTFEEFRRGRRNMWRTRWLLVGLGAVLAVVLVLSGAVIIGAVVGLMAVVRAALMLQWQRRSPWRGAWSGGPFPNR
jgi:Flp pilus assembly protein TadB